MLNLSEEQKKFIKDNFKDADNMIKTDNLDDILLPLDELITYQGFDDNYLPTKWGNEAERIYDEIYMQNKSVR